MTQLGHHTPRRISEPARRAALRSRGFNDGYSRRPKASTEQEYLTSYRRGREQKEAASQWM